MTQRVLCIGSVLWDVIGTSATPMGSGADVPGRIMRHPGGVALNIAKALAAQGVRPALLSAIGVDPEGNDLIHQCEALGLDTSHIHRPVDLPTDIYMAIEDARGLIAAIADAHSLEAAGADILTPLHNGQLGSAHTPFRGTVALDGNLTADLLQEIATRPVLDQADLRVAPASPGKAERLKPFLNHPSAVLYVNLEEAGLLCDTRFPTAETAALGLLANGASRALVTNGPDMACDACVDGAYTAAPLSVTARRITGAGDTFMAAHIAGELSGQSREAALAHALSVAATYVAGDTA